MAQVFLCHASEDKVQVKEIYSRLKRLGLQPWMDEEDLLPGQEWEWEIPKALRASDFVLIFLSRISVAKRGYVQREFKLVLDTLMEVPQGVIHTIPVRLDKCDVPEQFSKLQRSDLFDQHGFEKIVQAIHVGLSQRHRESPPIQLESQMTEERLPILTDTQVLGITSRIEPTEELFEAIFSSLNAHYGVQNWWVRDNKFQICVEAILAQGTGWKNVVLAIENLQSHNTLNPREMHDISESHLQVFIRPCGRKKSKALYIKNFVEFLSQKYALNIERMLMEETGSLRNALLKVKGIGPFTSDNILLYAGNRRKLPINDRMRKVFFEHDLIEKSEKYDSVQNRMESKIPFDNWRIREFDAMIYRVARDYCRSTPKCEQCPLKHLLPNTTANLPRQKPTAGYPCWRRDRRHLGIPSQRRGERFAVVLIKDPNLRGM